MVSDALSANRGHSTSQSVTVAGLNFQTYDVTASVSAGLAGCSTTAWTSGSAVACMQAATATPADRSLVVSVTANFVGTVMASFTFDGAHRRWCATLHTPPLISPSAQSCQLLS